MADDTTIAAAAPSPPDPYDYLLHLLTHLPLTIPEGARHYTAAKFKTTKEDLELTETADGALNHRLELVFGSRHQGPIIFKEKGEGLCLVIGILQKAITAAPSNVILFKWVEDLTTAAKAAYESARLPVRGVTARN